MRQQLYSLAAFFNSMISGRRMLILISKYSQFSEARSFLLSKVGGLSYQYSYLGAPQE